MPSRSASEYFASAGCVLSHLRLTRRQHAYASAGATQSIMSSGCSSHSSAEYSARSGSGAYANTSSDTISARSDAR